MIPSREERGRGGERKRMEYGVRVKSDPDHRVGVYMVDRYACVDVDKPWTVCYQFVGLL